jgi:hypothetical protein
LQSASNGIAEAIAALCLQCAHNSRAFKQAAGASARQEHFARDALTHRREAATSGGGRGTDGDQR